MCYSLPVAFSSLFLDCSNRPSSQSFSLSVELVARNRASPRTDALRRRAPRPHARLLFKAELHSLGRAAAFCRRDPALLLCAAELHAAPARGLSPALRGRPFSKAKLHSLGRAAALDSALLLCAAGLRTRRRPSLEVRRSRGRAMVGASGVRGSHAVPLLAVHRESGAAAHGVVAGGAHRAGGRVARMAPAGSAHGAGGPGVACERS